MYSDIINSVKSSYGFVTLEYESYYFKITCERGVIRYRLEINNNFASINSNIDHSTQVLAFSKKNILFILEVMKNNISYKN
ncbi:hypothetical protein M2326_001685 [Flavobacterium sp. 7A]|nr:hypothetical protein [Flavobacterium sp. 7A]